MFFLLLGTLIWWTDPQCLVVSPSWLEFQHLSSDQSGDFCFYEPFFISEQMTVISRLSDSAFALNLMRWYQPRGPPEPSPQYRDGDNHTFYPHTELTRFIFVDHMCVFSLFPVYEQCSVLSVSVIFFYLTHYTTHCCTYTYTGGKKISYLNGR